MITLKNPAAVSEWIIDLKEYSQVENSLPMTGLNVRNDSNITAYVDLDGLKVGEVQRYSADPFQGRNFSLIRIYNPDGQSFAPDDLFIQATKGEVMGSQPFNPQWDMMFDDLTRFATGTDSRVSLSDAVPMDLIKYYINLNNSVIVLRRVDIQAHATLLGQISIAFNTNNTLTIASGIGIPPPPDTVQHKALISNESFDCSETNAEIIGLVIDYLNNPDDISAACTITDGPKYAETGDKLNAVDNVIDTHAGTYQTTGTAYETAMLFEFSAQHIFSISYRLYYWQGGTQHVHLMVEYYDGSWHTLYTVVSGSTAEVEVLKHHSIDAEISKFRIRLKLTAGTTEGRTKIFDVSIIS